MKPKNGSEAKRSPLWILSFGLNLAACGQMLFWSDGFEIGFYNTVGVFLILFSAYLCLTLCLAEISSCLPFSGGSYALARVTAGPLIGFIVACADRIDLFGNISLSILVIGWISTTAIGIPQTYAQILSWCVVYGVGCFTLWTSSNDRYWWSMALISILYLFILLIFLIGCSITADFESGLPKKATYIAEVSEVLSLFPKCMLFYSGLHFIQVGVLDVKDPKKHIPRLLLVGVISSLFIGILLLFLVASHTPAIVVYSHMLPLPIIPALSSVFHTNPKFIALLLIPTFFASFQGNMFALYRVSMAMFQSNLLMVSGLAVKERMKLTNEQFFLLRSSVLIFLPTIVGFSLLREEWLWIAVQVAMLGTMTSQCANLYSFIVFRVQFSSLERGFVSPLGIAGAIYPFFVFILVIAGIVARGRSGRLSMIIYVFTLLVCIFSYFWKLQAQQQFSVEEEAALFVAHVIRHNVERVRRKKRRTSRMTNGSISNKSGQSSWSYFSSSNQSLRNSMSNDPTIDHDNHKDNKPQVINDAITQALQTAVSSVLQERKENQEELHREDSNTNPTSSTVLPASETLWSIETVTVNNNNHFSGQELTSEEHRTNSSDSKTTNDHRSNAAANTNGGAISSQRSASSRWHKPQQVLTQALASVNSSSMSTAFDNQSTPKDLTNIPNGADASEISKENNNSAYNLATQAFLSKTETGRKMQRDRRKEALIRAFKESSVDSYVLHDKAKNNKKTSNKSKVVPTAGIEEGSGAQVDDNNSDTLETNHSMPLRNKNLKLSTTTSQLLAAKRWAKLPTLRPLTLLQLPKQHDISEDEQERSISDRPSQQFHSPADNGESMKSPFSSSKRHSNSSEPVPIIADIKPGDLIDRYYREEQFNYHAFIDDVFGAAVSTPKHAKKQSSVAILPTISSPTSSSPLPIHPSATNNLKPGSDPDAIFNGRKLHRIVLPPELAALNPPPMSRHDDSFLAEHEVDSADCNNPSIVPAGAKVPPKVITLPSTLSMNQLDTMLLIQTPVAVPPSATDSAITGVPRFSPRVRQEANTAFSSSPQQENTLKCILSSLQPIITLPADLQSQERQACNTPVKRPTPKALPPLAYTALSSPTANATASIKLKTVAPLSSITDHDRHGES